MTAPRLRGPRGHMVREFHDLRPGAVTALVAHPDGRAFVGFLDGGLAELSACEVESGGTFIDTMALARMIRDTQAEEAKLDRVADILERGRQDPFGALAALEKEDPALADQLIARLEAMVTAKLDKKDGD